uniref:F-box domain-containing protein n=1 Tax=Tetranychus urticae TaxID=32264 RepID=T1KWM2_TETUR
MFINELPDECLLIIFGSINELDDLVSCYKEHYECWNGETSPNYALDHVYYCKQEQIDATCLSTFFPNLIIADFSGFLAKVKYETIVTLAKRMKSLKGVSNHYHYDRYESIFQYCDGLQMVSNYDIEPWIRENGANIKQLHLYSSKLDRFKEDAHCFPNLERLHIFNTEGSPDGPYDGPVLGRLKIVELELPSDTTRRIYYGFQFMDSCPNLQSAHISLQSCRLFVDESLTHKSLQDLVIRLIQYNSVYDGIFDWDELKRLFMKYPNLKHLALCDNRKLRDWHIERLVRILPNLVLFAVRGCPRVTQAAANYVQDYNKLYGRSIKFYFKDNYHEIQSDWPQLSTRGEKISQGFDFMKHCFLKDFDNLSAFLITSDN